MTAAGSPATTFPSPSDRPWVALPYAALLGCAVLTGVAGELAPARVLPALVACLAVAAWHGFWIVAHPQWREARLVPMAIYFLGLLALTDYLSGLSITFFPLYLVCYPMAFVALPGAWAYVGVGGTAVVALVGPPPINWDIEDLVIGFGAAVLVSIAGGAIRALEAETVRRHEAMATLSRTHAELERALAENLALQDRLLAEARDSGVSAERARLAGEIHDTLAAGLTGIVSQLEALGAELAPDHPLHSRLRTSIELARESLREARRAVGALRPGPLSDSTLAHALEAVVTSFEAAQEVAVHFRVSGDVQPVPAQVEDVLVRAAGEALTNVARHAHATAVHVTLTYLGPEVALDVADNGTGGRFPTAHGGYGLAIMRERVEGVGGRVSVDRSERGTTVTVIVPATAASPSQGAAEAPT